MPVRKYRSIEDMEDRLWVPPGTPEHRQAIQRALECAALFGAHRSMPRGVFKFRSVEASSAQREVWERQAKETKA